MKKILLIGLILFTTLVLTACSTKVFIVMKSEPLNSRNAQYYEQSFEQYQRIYYAIIAPNGFKDDAIKIEIVKVSDKVSSMGYSIQYAQDLAIDRSKNYYTNYFTISSGGLYMMQVFELRRPEKCLARYSFRVK